MRPVRCPVSLRWQARPWALSAMVRSLMVAVPSGPITPRRPPVPKGISSQNSSTSRSKSSASTSAATSSANSASAGSMIQRVMRRAIWRSIRPFATACSNRAMDDCTGSGLYGVSRTDSRRLAFLLGPFASRLAGRFFCTGFGFPGRLGGCLYSTAENLIPAVAEVVVGSGVDRVSGHDVAATILSRKVIQVGSILEMHGRGSRAVWWNFGTGPIVS